MSDKPTTTDEERAHGEAMARDMQNEGDTDQARASGDPAPEYEEDRSGEPPVYDPVEANEAPEYDPQPFFEEWMRNAGEDGGQE
jgi:hypothetical protein